MSASCAAELASEYEPRPVLARSFRGPGSNADERRPTVYTRTPAARAASAASSSVDSLPVSEPSDSTTSDPPEIPARCSIFTPSPTAS
jgi:hypothetical protein